MFINPNYLTSLYVKYEDDQWHDIHALCLSKRALSGSPMAVISLVHFAIIAYVFGAKHNEKKQVALSFSVFHGQALGQG